jgi:probable HAF family extracellular repeat protein
MTDLGTLGGNYSSAAAINNHGFVVGEAALPSGSARAFVYANGVMYDLGTLGGDSSYATAIDDANVIVGLAYTGPLGPNLDYPDGFVFLNGHMYDLNPIGFTGGSLYVFSSVSVNGVSDAGIVGNEDSDTLGGFGPTGVVALGGRPTAYTSTAENISSENGINQHGFAVGYEEDYLASTGDFGPQYATIYAGGVNYNLNTLVDLSTSDFTQLTMPPPSAIPTVSWATARPRTARRMPSC